MKRVLTTVAMGLTVYTAQAQLNKADEVKKSLATTNKDTVAWVYGGFVTLGMNEGFLHNWAAGGELASFNVNGIFSGHLDHLAHREIWSNNLDLSYGLNYNYSTSFIPRKTDDRIDFTSKYGRRIDTTGNFYFSGLFNFKSQITEGYDYTVADWQHHPPTSKFFSPAYFTLAAGVEYREGSDISLFVSPIAGRLTVADKYFTSLRPQGAFGIDYGKTMKYEFGAYISGRYLTKLSKNIRYKTRLDLYSNYLAKDSKDTLGNVVKKDNPGNIAILFDNLLDFRITKYMNATIGATFIYDNNFPYNKYDANGVLKDDPGRDIGWLQMKQMFTFGIEYKF